MKHEGAEHRGTVVDDVGGGEFVLRYTVPISGRYQLAVLLGHERRHIQGSPFTVVVGNATAGGTTNP